MVARNLKAFAVFWWMFLVGDAWELAVGGLAVLGLAFLLRAHPLVAAGLVPIGVVLVVGPSAWFGRNKG